MRHLRCIGGPRHGSVIGLAEHANHVLLIDPRSPLEPRVRYTERVAHAVDGQVRFLAPVDMTLIEALRIALGAVGDNSRRLSAEVDRLCALLGEGEEGEA